MAVTITIEAVVFDLDGTLVDHRGSVAAALRGWLPSLDSVGGEGYLDEVFAGYLDYYKAAWTAFHDVDDVIADHLSGATTRPHPEGVHRMS